MEWVSQYADANMVKTDFFEVFKCEQNQRRQRQHSPEGMIEKPCKQCGDTDSLCAVKKNFLP